MDEFTVSEETMVCAFRYALGKRNLPVGNIVRDLLDGAESFSQQTRQLMISEIKAKWGVNALGHKNDTEQWVNLLHRLDEIEKDNRLI